MYFRMPARSL